MNKLLLHLLLVILMAAPIIVSAQSISVETAKQRAQTFLSENNIGNARIKKSSATPELTLSHISQPNGELHYYAFNNTNGGFVIVSGNDATEEILGYSDHGSFDADNMSPNFRYWMEQYDRQIAFAIAQGKSLKPKQSVKAASRENIDILVATRWDQESPYYNFCPKKSGKRCLTGCVATAMAQVMKTHNWPVTGTGSHTYKDTQD